jgi:hypothetical protein
MENICDLFIDEFRTLGEAREALCNDYPDIPTDELFIVEDYGSFVIYRERI